MSALPLTSGRGLLPPGEISVPSGGTEMSLPPLPRLGAVARGRVVLGLDLGLDFARCLDRWRPSRLNRRLSRRLGRLVRWWRHLRVGGRRAGEQLRHVRVDAPELLTDLVSRLLKPLDLVLQRQSLVLRLLAGAGDLLAGQLQSLASLFFDLHTQTLCGLFGAGQDAVSLRRGVVEHLL